MCLISRPISAIQPGGMAKNSRAGVDQVTLLLHEPSHVEGKAQSFISSSTVA
jgi:hypothetical protein